VTRTRTRPLDAGLAGVAVGAPALALLELSTPMLIARPPSYLELQTARRAGKPLAGTGVAAALALGVRATRGQASRRLWLATVAGVAGVAVAAGATYDPWLFAPRRRPVRVRPATAAEEVLGGDTEVIGVRVNGEARAYPARMLARPHILTDTLGGEAIAVSYCGLTNSAIAYRTTTGDGDMGISVLSAPRNNILYRERDSGSLVQQLLPEVAYGPAAGRPLTTIPVVYTTWNAWRQLAPDTTLAESRYESHWDRLVSAVMRREHMRTRDRPATLLATGEVDHRLPRKTQLFGLVHSGQAAAYTRRRLQADPVINDTVGDEPIVVLHEPTSGISMAYQRRLNGQTLDLRPTASIEDNNSGGGLATDVDTGSTWDVLGRCLHGPRAGDQLQAVPFSFDKPFWFAWAAYNPHTRLHATEAELADGHP
jgi:hypothetical protein